MFNCYIVPMIIIIILTIIYSYIYRPNKIYIFFIYLISDDSVDVFSTFLYKVVLNTSSSALMIPIFQFFDHKGKEDSDEIDFQT